MNMDNNLTENSASRYDELQRSDNQVSSLSSRQIYEEEDNYVSSSSRPASLSTSIEEYQESSENFVGSVRHENSDLVSVEDNDEATNASPEVLRRSETSYEHKTAVSPLSRTLINKIESLNLNHDKEETENEIIESIKSNDNSDVVMPGELSPLKLNGTISLSSDEDKSPDLVALKCRDSNLVAKMKSNLVESPEEPVFDNDDDDYEANKTMKNVVGNLNISLSFVNCIILLLLGYLLFLLLTSINYQ